MANRWTGAQKSILVEWDPEAPEEVWLWCIATADASHYRVIFDGHCSYWEAPSVLSYLLSAVAGDIPYGDGAPNAVAQ